MALYTLFQNMHKMKWIVLSRLFWTIGNMFLVRTQTHIEILEVQINFKISTINNRNIAQSQFCAIPNHNQRFLIRCAQFSTAPSLQHLKRVYWWGQYHLHIMSLTLKNHVVSNKKKVAARKLVCHSQHTFVKALCSKLLWKEENSWLWSHLVECHSLCSAPWHGSA